MAAATVTAARRLPRLIAHVAAAAAASANSAVASPSASFSSTATSACPAPGANRRTRAIIVESFGGPEVMRLGNRELPPLGSKQVLVAIKAAGVNPSDTYVRLGPAGPYAGKAHLLPPLPYTPGKDGAGVIEALGSDVGGFKVGDRVYLAGSVSGTYAASAVCDADTVHALPASTSFAQGACLGVPAATAYFALRFRAALRAGERVFVHGASGAVGLAAVQLAKRAVGASGLVVGSAGTEGGAAAVRSAGADAVVNHREEDYLEKSRKASPGGYDVILEMSAHSNLPADLSLAAHRARVCIIGSRSEDVGVNPRHVMSCECDIRGVFLGMASREELAETHHALHVALEEGALVPIVAAEMPLSEAPAAHVEVMQPASGGAAGNIVLVP